MEEQNFTTLFMKKKEYYVEDLKTFIEEGLPEVEINKLLCDLSVRLCRISESDRFEHQIETKQLVFVKINA